MSYYYLDHLFDLDNPASINDRKVSNTDYSSMQSAAKDYLNLTTYFGENPYDSLQKFRAKNRFNGMHSNVGTNWHYDFLRDKPPASSPFASEWDEWQKTLAHTKLDQLPRTIIAGQIGGIDFDVPCLIEAGTAVALPTVVVYNDVDWDSTSGPEPLDVHAFVATDDTKPLKFIPHTNGVMSGIVYAEIRVRDRGACITAGFNPSEDSYYREILIVPPGPAPAPGPEPTPTTETQKYVSDSPTEVNTRGELTVDILGTVPGSKVNNEANTYTARNVRVHPRMAIVPEMITVVVKWEERLPDPRGGTYLRSRRVILPPGDYTTTWLTGNIGYLIGGLPLGIPQLTVIFEDSIIYDPNEYRNKLYYIHASFFKPIPYALTITGERFEEYAWVWARTNGAEEFLLDLSKATFAWTDGLITWPAYYDGMTRQLKISVADSTISGYVDVPIRPQRKSETKFYDTSIESFTVTRDQYHQEPSELAKTVSELISVRKNDEPVEFEVEINEEE